MNTDMFKPRVRQLFALAFAGLIALFGDVAYAQTTTASIRGYVTETGGGAVSDAGSGDPEEHKSSTSRLPTLLAFTSSEARLQACTKSRSDAWVATSNAFSQISIGQTVDLNLSTSEAPTQLSSVEVRSNATGTDSRTSKSERISPARRLTICQRSNASILDLAEARAESRPRPSITGTSSWQRADSLPRQSTSLLMERPTRMMCFAAASSDRTPARAIHSARSHPGVSRTYSELQSRISEGRKRDHCCNDSERIKCDRGQPLRQWRCKILRSPR